MENKGTELNFTDAELMMIDQALSEYQDHIESDEDSDVYESMMSKMLSLLSWWFYTLQLYKFALLFY